MARGYHTTDTLINLVQLKAMLPENQVTFTREDFLTFVNEEIKIGIVPSILVQHEEYYVHSEEVALVANKSRYPVPYRAIGGKLRDFFLKDEQGNLMEMTRISPEDKAYYQSSVANYYAYYYFQGNDIVLVPGVGESPTASLVFEYFLRPNDLVEEERAATISSVVVDDVAGTTTYIVDQIPTDFTPVEMDILQTKSGHRTRVYDVTPTIVDATGLSVTFNTDDLSDDIIVGDYIVLAGECIIPQVPSDLHTVVAQRAAARCVEALGDKDGLAAANLKLQEMEVKTGILMDNRNEGSSLKVSNKNGLLRRRR